MAGIEIEGLTVRRGGRPVLTDLSCGVEQGRVTGLLGPSGSGKTTLIRAVVGVQKVAGGAVRVLGHPAGSAELRHQIGYVSQAPSVYADLTVEENVRYFAALLGFDRAAARDAVDQVGLSDAARQLVGTLSGGQQSRASLACALVGEPKVLVLDEPTVGQDPVLREELWDALVRRAGSGVTVVVSSHVMSEANRCEKLLLIRDGAILIDDTPTAVKATAGTDDLDDAFLALIRSSVAA